MSWLYKISLPVLRFSSECTGAAHHQVDCIIKAYMGEQLVGYLKYAEFDGETYIQHIEVAEDLRRQGIATALYEQLKKEAGGKIQHTNQTPEGAAWRRSLADVED